MKIDIWQLHFWAYAFELLIRSPRVIKTLFLFTKHTGSYFFLLL
jgi:hypothetical protein